MQAPDLRGDPLILAYGCMILTRLQGLLPVGWHLLSIVIDKQLIVEYN